MIEHARGTAKSDLKQVASELFSAAISAADPELCVGKCLKLE